MPQAQPYGINVAGELMGLALIVAIMIPFWGSKVTRWSLLSIFSVLSAYGSLGVFTLAVPRGDVGVAAYHAVFVLLPLWFLPATVRAYRQARPTSTPRVETATRRDERVYVITKVPPRPEHPSR